MLNDKVIFVGNTNVYTPIPEVHKICAWMLAGLRIDFLVYTVMQIYMIFPFLSLNRVLCSHCIIASNNISGGRETS